MLAGTGWPWKTLSKSRITYSSSSSSSSSTLSCPGSLLPFDFCRHFKIPNYNYFYTKSDIRDLDHHLLISKGKRPTSDHLIYTHGHNIHGQLCEKDKYRQNFTEFESKTSTFTLSHWVSQIFHNSPTSCSSVQEKGLRVIASVIYMDTSFIQDTDNTRIFSPTNIPLIHSC